MRTKKGLLVLAMAALPLASVVLLEGPAMAGKVTGTGKVTCHVSGKLFFNPPLTPNGTAASKEIVTVETTSSHCTGGSPAASPGSTLTKPVKIKGTKVNGTKISGACKGAASGPGATVKGKQNWNGGVKPSKLTLTNVKFGLDGVTGEVDETGAATTAGSYAGTGTVHLDFNTANSNALKACTLGTSNAKISSATLDETNSTIS